MPVQRRGTFDLTSPSVTAGYALPAPPAWTVDALCAQTDPESFFPEKGGSTREAKKVCAACPVRFQCLEYALEQQDHFGIWGGLSERDRRNLVRGRVVA